MYSIDVISCTFIVSLNNIVPQGLLYKFAPKSATSFPGPGNEVACRRVETGTRILIKAGIALAGNMSDLLNSRSENAMRMMSYKVVHNEVLSFLKVLFNS